MAPQNYPSADKLREVILKRIKRFSALTGMTKTEIGLKALNDGAFVGRIEGGSNFMIGTYQRLMDWLDQHWPEQEAPPRQRSAAGAES